MDKGVTYLDTLILKHSLELKNVEPTTPHPYRTVGISHDEYQIHNSRRNDDSLKMIILVDYCV